MLELVAMANNLSTGWPCLGSLRKLVPWVSANDETSSEMKTFSVAVVIPTCDRLELLREAVESVLRSADVVEKICSVVIIVVNDGATEIEDLPSDARIQVIRNVHSAGPAGARNTGIDFTTADLVAFLDDDDVYLESHLRVHLEARQYLSEPFVTYSQGQFAEKVDGVFRRHWIPIPKAPLPTGMIQEYLLDRRLGQLDAIMVDRHALRQVGGFDENLRYWEDHDLIERLGLIAQFHGIEEVSVLWRLRRREPMRFRDWTARHQDSLVVRRRSLGRSAEFTGGRIKRAQRWIRERGADAADATGVATQCLSYGLRSDAAKLLAKATVISPIHVAFRVPGFWRSVHRLVTMQQCGPSSDVPSY